jgi:hypothetical protein
LHSAFEDAPAPQLSPSFYIGLGVSQNAPKQSLALHAPPTGPPQFK